LASRFEAIYEDRARQLVRYEIVGEGAIRVRRPEDIRPDQKADEADGRALSERRAPYAEDDAPYRLEHGEAPDGNSATGPTPTRPSRPERLGSVRQPRPNAEAAAELRARMQESLQDVSDADDSAEVAPNDGETDADSARLAIKAKLRDRFANQDTPDVSGEDASVSSAEDLAELDEDKAEVQPDIESEAETAVAECGDDELDAAEDPDAETDEADALAAASDEEDRDPDVVTDEIDAEESAEDDGAAAEVVDIAASDDSDESTESDVTAAGEDEEAVENDGEAVAEGEDEAAAENEDETTADSDVELVAEAEDEVAAAAEAVAEGDDTEADAESAEVQTDPSVHPAEIAAAPAFDAAGTPVSAIAGAPHALAVWRQVLARHPDAAENTAFVALIEDFLGELYGRAEVDEASVTEAEGADGPDEGDGGPAEAEGAAWRRLA
jgi:hypothetical protein